MNLLLLIFQKMKKLKRTPSDLKEYHVGASRVTDPFTFRYQSKGMKSNSHVIFDPKA